ncbi:hypothetical protein ACFPRL_23420 [Pseudoclavibacter helvolus]
MDADSVVQGTCADDGRERPQGAGSAEPLRFAFASAELQMRPPLATAVGHR